MSAVVIERLGIVGYRSIRDLETELGELTVIVGGNGSGKTNFYRAMSLVAAAARGGLAHAIAEEGGMPSVVWAGPSAAETDEVRIKVDGDVIGYELAFGVQSEPRASAFSRDPEIKSELVWTPELGGAREVLAARDGLTAHLESHDGGRDTHPGELTASESLLCQLRDRHRFPELAVLADHLGRWRFYHRFRTDRDAALRNPQVGVKSPVLADDGADLAAALQTIIELGDRDAMATAIRDAFGGGEVMVEADDKARMTVTMRMPGVRRALEACELSDGTLRYLCLVAGLLSPRPPSLLALNAPETSLHPDLVEPLATLIVRAARSSQVLVTTHSRALTDAIRSRAATKVIELALTEGETHIID